MAVSQQLIGLFGVLVGSFATYLATSAGERVRWRRSQQVRWDENRMRAYAEYGSAVKRWAHLADRVAAARGLGRSADPLAPNDGLPELAIAEEERVARWQAVLLLGSPATVAAGREWHFAVYHLVCFARGQLTDPERWEAAKRQADINRDLYYECARYDLGVTSGRLPPLYWPPAWMLKPQFTRGTAPGSVPDTRPAERSTMSLGQDPPT